MHQCIITGCAHTQSLMDFLDVFLEVVLVFVDIGTDVTLVAVHAMNRLQVRLHVAPMLEHLRADLALRRLQITYVVHRRQVLFHVAFLIENLAAHYTRELVDVTDAVNVAQVHAQVGNFAKHFAANLTKCAAIFFDCRLGSCWIRSTHLTLRVNCDVMRAQRRRVTEDHVANLTLVTLSLVV